MFEQISNDSLDKVSVSIEKLSSNIGTIIGSCGASDLEAKSALINNYPLVAWLLSTPLTQKTRAALFNNTSSLCNIKEEDGQIMIKQPTENFWSKLPTSTENECCWAPVDFEKCGSYVPLNLFCLKDCDSILKTLLAEQLKVNRPAEFAGGTLKAKQEDVAKQSMAFFTAYNAVLGLDNTWTSILKPFHGVLQLMENPAVFKQAGTNLLSAVDSVGCRLSLLKGRSTFVAWMNPVTMKALEAVVVPGQYGQLPRGWKITPAGEYVYDNFITFKVDPFIPVDLTTNTGEIWIMSGDNTGLLLGTSLIPGEKFIRRTNQVEEYADGCASSCTYYYNYGAALNNNALKLAMITDIPLTGACVNAITDIPQLVNPTTLIPDIQ